CHAARFCEWRMDRWCAVRFGNADRMEAAAELPAAVSFVASRWVIAGSYLSASGGGMAVAHGPMGGDAAMTGREQIFSAWAPDTSVWSRWVKPVLFAHLDSALSQIPVRELAATLSWAPP